MRHLHLHLHLLLALAPPVVLSGCVFGVAVPAHVNLPAPLIDLDAARARFEAGVCRDAAADACAVLDALDRSDGAASLPVALPDRMPQHIAVAALGGEEVDVQRWFGQDALPQSGVELVPSRLVRLDSGALQSLSAAMIDEVTVESAALRVADNGLSLDLGSFDVYVGHGLVPGGDDGADEADVPADPEAAVHIAVSAAHDAGVDGRAPLFLAEGAVVALRAALAEDDPWIELRPTGETPQLRLDDDRFLPPSGQAEIALDLQLTVPLDVEAGVAR